MAVRHGYGKIAGADALVFAYDTGDTRNSYKGEPTENLYAGLMDLPTSWSIGTNTSYVGTTEGPLPGTVGYKYEVLGYGNFYLIYSKSGLTAGATYTVSVYVKMVVGTSTNNNGVLYSTDYNAAIPPSTNITSEWKRIHYTFTLGASSTYANIVLFGYDNLTGNVLAYSSPQLELKSHPTQFVNGTRSATQGLLDLTGTGTISIDNATYDSSAMMTFDGSNDYISTSNSYNGSDSLSVEAICKFYSVSSPGDQVVYFNANGQGLYPRLFKSTSNKFFMQYRPSGTTTSITGNTTLQANQFYHTVFTYDATTGGIFYINGTVDGTNSGVVGNHEKGNGHAIRIGNDTNVNYYMNGEIPVVKKYNRVLTAAEVANNYRHYKTRFNI